MKLKKLIVMFFIFLCLNIFSKNEKVKIKNIQFKIGLKKQGLIDIKPLVPSILINMKYSTKDNFLKKDAYGNFNKCFLQKTAAKKLIRAQKILKRINPKLTLLVYDCLRPRRVQHQMWKIVKGTPRQRYVANPYRGSIHNYGCAVDLTIAAQNGIPLDMGTPFDFFGKRAQPRYERYFFKKGKLTRKHLKNRRLLRYVMKKAGFIGIRSEWWHYNAFSNAYVKKRYKIVE